MRGSASYARCAPARGARAAATPTDGMHARAISPCTRSTGASCSAVVLRTDAGRAGERVGTGEGKCGGNRPPAEPRYFQSTTKNAERHGGSVWLEGRAERSIFRHGNARDLHMIAQCGLHAPEDVSREILSGGHEPAVRELRDVQIDIAVIETIADFTLQHGVQPAQVNEKPGYGIDGSRDSDVADVTVTMVIRPCAGAERRRVALVTPFSNAITVRRGERDAARKGRGHSRKIGLATRTCEAD